MSYFENEEKSDEENIYEDDDDSETSVIDENEELDDIENEPQINLKAQNEYVNMDDDTNIDNEYVEDEPEYEDDEEGDETSSKYNPYKGGSKEYGTDSDDDDDDDVQVKDDDLPDILSIKKKQLIPINNKKPDSFEDDEDDDDEDEDDTYGDYLQKFNSKVNENYILKSHPECQVQNYDEILSLVKVIRDKNGIIIDDLHKTIPYLTKYERTRILGQRTKQLNSGSTPFVKVPENMIDGYLIAELELKQKRIPFIIRRPIPNGGSEYWSLKDLEDIYF